VCFALISSPPPVAAPGVSSDPARQLQTEGFVALPRELNVGPELAATVAAECHDRLNHLLEAVDAAGCNVVEQQYSFAEICHRKRLRWDIRMPETPAWAALCRSAVESAGPYIREACGGSPGEEVRVIMSGAVVSRPGALEQSFHADGEGGLFNIFIPLVDIEPEDDGTQYWPGSHLTDPSMERVLGLVDDAAAMGEMASPGCAAGGFLAFDYRTIHRGRINNGRERAVAYVVCTADPDAADRKNFPDLSVFDAEPGYTEYIPFFDESAGDTWRAQLPRLHSATNKLVRALQQRANLSEGAAAAGADDRAVRQQARSMVRDHIKASGLDEMAIQSRITATNSLAAQVERERG